MIGFKILLSEKSKLRIEMVELSLHEVSVNIRINIIP
jgi:hypothetical protein